MIKTIVYVHGKGGTAEEAERFKPLFKGYDVIGFDYKAATPWDAMEEFGAFAESLCEKVGKFVLIANSLGAYFSACGFCEKQVEKAFFISPVADMEELILNMIKAEGTTEEELRKRGEIQTAFGETLSWKYLNYVRKNPVVWKVPTEILYGEKDCLIPRKTVAEFAEKIGARLTVMENGEHWFHTKEQLEFLDLWLSKSF